MKIATVCCIMMSHSLIGRCHMKEIIAFVISYMNWIFAPENIRVNIFTLISVVLSGVVSWIISAIYFRFGNRNNLKSSVLYPMRTVLSDEPTWQRYKELTSLLKDHSARYLRKGERAIIDRLLIQRMLSQLLRNVILGTKYTRRTMKAMLPPLVSLG